MLEKITGTFGGIVKKLSGKSTITEKNIEESVEEIKMALLEADVNLRVVRRFVNSTIEEAKGEKVLKSPYLLNDNSYSSNFKGSFTLK